MCRSVWIIVEDEDEYLRGGQKEGGLGLNLCLVVFLGEQETCGRTFCCTG